MCKCEHCGSKIDCGDPACQKTIPWCSECSKLTVPISTAKKVKKKQEVKIFSNITLQIIYESKKPGIGESLKSESKTVGPIIRKALECIKFFPYRFSIDLLQNQKHMV